MAKSYTYDAENRQVTANMNGTVSNYSYDGNGLRVSRVVGSQITIYVYDAWGNLAAEYPNWADTSSCDTPTCYAIEDHLGSTRLLTDASGSGNVARYDYQPFGQELLAGIGSRTTGEGYQSAPDGMSPKFTGQQRDQDTGLDWYQVRHMNGTQGRFQSVDPANAGADAGDPQTWNGYAYVGNNPLSFVDPSGTLGEAAGVGAATCGPVCAGIGAAVDVGIALWAVFGGGGAPATMPTAIATPPDPILGSIGSDFADCKSTLKGCPAKKSVPSGFQLWWDSLFSLRLVGGCPAVPERPGYVNLRDNIHRAQQSALLPTAILRLEWFYQNVRNGGPWDYKQAYDVGDSGNRLPSRFQDFGNFNYGATGAAAGIEPQVLLRGAGWAQERAKTSRPSWGHWYSVPSFGDDPNDQASILAGIAYYKNGCYK